MGRRMMPAKLKHEASSRSRDDHRRHHRHVRQWTFPDHRATCSTGIMVITALPYLPGTTQKPISSNSRPACSAISLPANIGDALACSMTSATNSTSVATPGRHHRRTRIHACLACVSRDGRFSSGRQPGVLTTLARQSNNILEKMRPAP